MSICMAVSPAYAKADDGASVSDVNPAIRLMESLELTTEYGSVIFCPGIYRYPYPFDYIQDTGETEELLPEEEKENVRQEPEQPGEYLGEFFLTYYCPGSCCNGKWGSIDGFGDPLAYGCVAVDSSVIPLRTKLRIDGYPDVVFEARDTGSGVNGKHIDIFVPVSHSEALTMCKDERRSVWKVAE